MKARTTQNKACLKRKLDRAKLTPNPPLDALRKDFAQRAKPQPKAATDQRFGSTRSGGGARESAACAASTRPSRPRSKAAKVLVVAGRPASVFAHRRPACSRAGAACVKGASRIKVGAPLTPDPGPADRKAATGETSWQGLRPQFPAREARGSTPPAEAPSTSRVRRWLK